MNARRRASLASAKEQQRRLSDVDVEERKRAIAAKVSQAVVLDADLPVHMPSEARSNQRRSGLMLDAEQQSALRESVAEQRRQKLEAEKKDNGGGESRGYLGSSSVAATAAAVGIGIVVVAIFLSRRRIILK